MPSSIFQQQLDYIYFVYGFAFILLSAICVSFRQKQAAPLPWLWLGLFGVIHGVTEWLDMFALSLGDSQAFAIIRLAGLAASFVFLLEFGRDGLRKLGGKAPGRWSYIVLIVAVAPASLAGLPGMNAAVRYAFGLTGGLWAAWTLWWASSEAHILRMEKEMRRSLRVAAIFMALYALAAGAVVPQAGFFPAAMLDQESFFRLTGVPIQLVRGLLAVIITTALWRYLRQASQVGMPEAEQTIKANNGLQVTLFLLVIVGVGWVYTTINGNDADQKVRANILSLAKITTASLKVDQVQALTGTLSDLTLTEYQSLRSQLVEINRSSPIRRVYLLALKEGAVTFNMDSLSVDDPAHAEPGVVYEKPPHELINVFRSGKAVEFGPYSVESGSYISGFVPILDPSSGVVLQVLGMDFNTGSWQSQVARSRLFAINATLLIGLIFIGFFIARQRMWESAQRIALSERRMSEAQRMTHLGSWTFNPETNQFVWSQEMFRLYGRDPLAGAPNTKDYAASFSIEDWDRINAALQHSVHSGQDYELEFCAIRPDGSARWITSRAQVKRGRDGEVVQLVGTDLDITDRKKAEADVAAWKKRYDQVTTDTRQLVYEFDASNGKILWGESLGLVLGYTPQEMQAGAAQWASLIHPEDRAAVLTLLKTALQKHSRFEAEYRILHKDGEYRWVCDQASFGRAAGAKPTLMTGRLQDITESKQAGEALQLARQALEQANVELEKANVGLQKTSQEKDQFMANLSQEMRAPVNAVIGMSGLLLGTQLTRFQHDYADTVRANGEILLDLINALLDFTKMGSQKLVLENQAFDLRACIEDVLDLSATRASEKNLDLAYRIDAGMPLLFTGDVGHLRQILLTLLSNGIKYTEKGEVVISVSGQQREKGGYQLHFSVKDSGIGIPSDRMERLFQSFGQMDGSTMRRSGGSGLGLAFSKQLCELMGGRMWVESSGLPGRGSTFHFSVLVEAAADQSPAYIEGEHSKLADKSVLFVDDNRANCQILVVQARAWGMRATGVVSPGEALALMQQKTTFDLAVLDYQMPEMDGVNLAGEMRKFKVGKDLPLVLLRSPGSQNDAADRQLFQALLSKPIKYAQLFRVLASVAAHEAVPEENVSASQMVYDREIGRTHPLRILVAEDNGVDQKAALGILEQIGYQGDIAASGSEVLEALNRQPYDVILMDEQLPEMDETQISQLIRLQFPSSRQPHIILLTSETLSGNRERYLAIGMDDTISKPLRVEDLVRALLQSPALELRRTIAATPASPALSTPLPTAMPIPTQPEDGQAEAAAGVSAPVTPPARSGSVNPAVGLDQADIFIQVIDPATLRAFHDLFGEGGLQMVTELVNVYLADSPKLIEEMRLAVANANAQELSRAAHTLKGTSNQVGALRLARVCLQLEKSSWEGTLDGALAQIELVEEEYQRAALELKK